MMGVNLTRRVLHQRWMRQFAIYYGAQVDDQLHHIRYMDVTYVYHLAFMAGHFGRLALSQTKHTDLIDEP